MKLFFGMLLAVIMLFGNAAWADSNTTPANATSASHHRHHDNGAKPASAQVVNINTADVATLSTLKSIGKKRAAAIVAYRQLNGPFKSISDLTKVKGISQKVVEKNKDRLTVG